MKKFVLSPVYLLIMVCCALISLFVVPMAVVAAAMLIIRITAESKRKKELETVISELDSAKTELALARSELEAPLYVTYKETNGELEHIRSDIELMRIRYTREEDENRAALEQLCKEIEENRIKAEKSAKQVQTQTRKVLKLRELCKSMEYAVERFPLTGEVLSAQASKDLEELVPGIMLKLHCMESKELRKAYRENDQKISQVLDMYSDRYTTKANKAIYQLMVIALRAELQNVLYNLKYDKLETSITAITEITEKYLKIAGDGNQSIVKTLKKFIGQLEYLFINAAKIEYNYYVKREQARQEQAAIREQMKQEAEERKALLEEKRKVEMEEQKYQSEIEKLQSQISSAEDSEASLLQSRILELQSQLADVAVKKDEIVKLSNGKAGTVYVISNLGAFGDHVFKIGMTRRVEPMDRVKELGSASVPFQFDVHSLIFSNDAVELETRLHRLLNDRRVNKVNLKKEFFDISLDELEELVYQTEPTADFNRTMLAEEYRQSVSSDGNYTSDYTGEDAGPDEDDMDE